MSDFRNPKDDEAFLDTLFDSGKHIEPMSDAFREKLHADAVAALGFGMEPQQRSVWARMMDALGGWMSVSGLATATLAGVYIGFAQPEIYEGVVDLTGTDMTSELLFGDEIYFSQFDAEEI